MGTVTRLSIAFGLVLLSPLPTLAKTAGVDVKLISERSSIRPGQPFSLGLHFKHHPGFHTYWKNPGIVGVATALDWKLPAGFEAGEIRWPWPEEVDMAGHPAHGYHRNVVLEVEIIPPDEIADDEITLTAEAVWMACAKTCHPGFETVAITLPVEKDAPLDPKTAALFARSRKEVPAASDAWTVQLRSRADEQEILLFLQPNAEKSINPEAVYFFSSDGQVSSKPAQVIKKDGEKGFLLSMQRAEFSPKDQTTLPGVLRIPSEEQENPPVFIAIEPEYLENVP